MCSAAVLLCVCGCRMRVRVRTCHTTSLSSSVPAVQIPSNTCVCGCVQRCAHSSRCLCVQHIHDMCSAAVLVSVCVCRIRERVRTCHTTSLSSSVPAVRIPSITCVCIIYYICSLDYASPATAVRPVTSVSVFQHITSYTFVQRNPCAHCHHTMRPSSPNYAVPFTGD